MIFTLVVQFDTVFIMSELLPYLSSSQLKLDVLLAVTSSPSQGYDTNKHTRALGKAWYTFHKLSPEDIVFNGRMLYQHGRSSQPD